MSEDASYNMSSSQCPGEEMIEKLPVIFFSPRLFRHVHQLDLAVWLSSTK